MDAAAHAGDLRARCVDDLFLCVVHHHHARIDALADDGTRCNRAVDVEQLDPVVVHNAGAFGVVFAEPDHRAAAAQREHHQVVAVGRVDAPLLVRRDEVQRDLGVAIGLDAVDAGRGLEVNRWPVAAKAFAKRAHPRVVHVELLAPGQRAPGDHLVHVGVAGVVGDGLRLDAAPGWRADDFARLRLDVAKANLLVFAVQREVRVIESSLLAQRLPGFHRHMAVGFRCELQHDFAGINVGVDPGHTAAHAFS